MTKELLHKGFTLIETLIYIALLGLLMSGTLVAVYRIAQSADTDERKNTIEQEGSFVLRKIDGTLTGTSTLSRILAPSSGEYSDTLSIITVRGVRIDMCREGSAIYLREGSDSSVPCSDISYLPLTTSNVTASTLRFYQTSTGRIEASTTIDGVVFEMERILQY